MTDDQAWQKWWAIELVRLNAEANNALLAVFKKPKFRHVLRTMAELQSVK
jgi:hypothetical protein